MTILKPFNGLPAQLRLSLGDRNQEVAEALVQAFLDVPDVEVIHGNLLDLECDGIVSPANSFGDMGGGIDKAIDDYHRGAAQQEVTAMIRRDFLGELPVGMAVVVTVARGRLGHVVVAPTMRIPGDIRGTIQAYLAMRAALVAVLRFNLSGGALRTLAIPGLGTGVGGMPYPEAAQQMRMAYDNVIGGKWKHVIHPAMAPYAWTPQ